MKEAIAMIWTTLFHSLSVINRTASTLDHIVEVAEVNAKNFRDQELMEAEARTADIREQIKARQAKATS